MPKETVRQRARKVLEAYDVAGNWQEIVGVLSAEGLLLDEKAERCVEACKRYAKESIGAHYGWQQQVIDAGRAYDEPGPWRTEHTGPAIGAVEHWVVSGPQRIRFGSAESAIRARDALNAAWAKR